MRTYIKEYLKSVCGVYILYEGAEIVYIGQSVNAPARITAHLDGLKKGNKKFDAWDFILCERSELDRIETEMITKHLPKYNVTHNPLATPKPTVHWRHKIPPKGKAVLCGKKVLLDDNTFVKDGDGYIVRVNKQHYKIQKGFKSFIIGYFEYETPTTAFGRLKIYYTEGI